MSDHKPECVLSDPCSADEPRHGFCGNSDFSWCMHCEQQCDCERIKRTEDRVLAEREADGPWFRSVVHDCCVDKQTAYADGLDAARGAIEALRGCLGTDDNGDGTVWVEKADALDAIDALRGDR